MQVEVFFSDSHDRQRVDSDLLMACLSWAGNRLANVQPDSSMSVLLADAAEISRLHDEFFGDPSLTDVVSFPSGEDPGGDGAYLGDVAIGIDVAEEQARDAGHSVQREVVFLALHGLLHLIGYEDGTEDERQRMIDLQEELLTGFEMEVGRL